MASLVAKSNPARILKGVFIVRDKDSNPIFADPRNVPQNVLDALTEKDKEHLKFLQTEAK